MSQSQSQNVPENRAGVNYTVEQVMGPDGNKQSLFRLRNKLVVVSLDESHEIVSNAVPVSRVEYLKSIEPEGTSQLALKKVAPFVQPDSHIATVWKGDKEYIIVAGIKGHIMETNTKLLSNPNLLITEREGAGYIAIIRPKR